MTDQTHASPDLTLAQAFNTLLFDLDGVVYVGPDAVPHAAEAIALARESGSRCVYVTNNASRTAGAVAEHLTSLGVPCTAGDVVTSPQAAVSVLAEYVPPGARVLVIGGAGIADVLTERGYVPVWTSEEDPAAVVQGFSPDVGWRELAEATFAVRSGIPWIATNPDLTFPTPRGAAPGNGALVALVAATVGRPPNAIAGKPEPPLLHEAMARAGAQRALMIGDRLDTDIEAGARIDVPTLLVMTGVTTVGEVLHARPVERPTFIGADLRVLNEPYVPVQVSDDRTQARCGEAEVTVDDTSVGETRLSIGAPPGAATEVLRAASALMWALADSGVDLRAVDETPVTDLWQAR